MKRFLRNAAIWLARIAVVLIVLLIVFYAEEDWRGARDWAACQRDLAAKGESLDLRQLAPPGKPEDDLSKVPIFAELYRQDEEYQKTKKSSISPRIDRLDVEFRSGLVPPYGSAPQPQNYLKGKPLNLTEWQKYYHADPGTALPATLGTPAQDVLQALTIYEPELDEIDKAMSNPNAFGPVDYDKGFGYMGGALKTVSIAKILQFRATAELENSQSDLAEKDLFACLRLNQPLTKCFFFVNFLVVAANQNMAYGILWEGIRRHAWSDGQLREIEFAFGTEDALADAVRALRTERAFSIQVVRQAQAKFPKASLDWGGDEPAMDYLFYTWSVRPKGWWNQDRRSYALEFQSLVEAIHPDSGSIDSDAFAAEDAELPQPIWTEIYTPFTAMAIPIDRRMGPRIARTETYRRLARLACRLEEYRIANGQYPGKLDQLPDLPPHLAHEVVGANFFKYRQKDEGYTLYSIGWDQIDDNGALKKPGREVDQGGMINNSWDADWPWPSPVSIPVGKK